MDVRRVCAGAWGAAAGAAAAVVVLGLHRSGEPSIFGRWSGGYAALLGAVSLAGIGCGVLARLPDFRLRAVMETATRRARWLAPRLGVLAAACAVLFLAGEGVLRLLGPRVGCWRGLDTGRNDAQGHAYRLNRARYRDDDHETVKPAGVFRILVLGDSFAFGQGVPEDETWTRRLPGLLAERGVGRVEVINAGKMARNTVHEVRDLRDYGLAFTPDLVLVSFCLNDADTDDGYYRVRRPVPGFVEPWLEWSCLYRLTRRGYHTAQVRAGWVPSFIEFERATFRDDHPGWRACRRALQEIAELSRAHGARPAVLLWPLAAEERPYPLLATHAFLMDAFRATGYEALDLEPVLSPYESRDLQVLPGEDSHPNAKACGLAAQALAGFLVERGLVPVRKP